MKDIRLDEYGNQLEPLSDKIALIDADTIAYTACLSEYEVMVLDESFYHREEWEKILNNPTYNADEGVYYEIDMEEAKAKAEEKISRIKERVGCENVELHFSTGKNFRYIIFPDYKLNRKSTRAPLGLKEMKEYLSEKYNGVIHKDWESDDMVVYLGKTFPEKYIVCAVDKDVIYSVPGRVFNYYESNHYNIDMKWVDVSKRDVLYWPYIQCILGDSGDGVLGPKGIGPKTCAKFFNGKPLPKDIGVKKAHEVLPHIIDGLTHKELWEAVLKGYKSKGVSEEVAIMNMNLVNMHMMSLKDDKDSLVSCDTYQINKWSPE